ncbi:MAG: glycoside hydrolase family 172 protein [Bryobacterales bacterium]|nr:glycoside hydrolase family 172 protein [Bryobacterales bacterium]
MRRGAHVRRGRAARRFLRPHDGAHGPLSVRLLFQPGGAGASSVTSRCRFAGPCASWCATRPYASCPSLYYDVNYTLGDIHSEDVLYFHAHFRRENPTALQRDYEFLPTVRGRGRFLGVFFGVIADQKKYSFTWWGEGEVKFYLDGDRELPTLAGTGTEDYISTAWGQGRFDHLYHGCPVADFEKMQYSFYRFHVPDPIYFYQDIRATIQQIGYLNPRWMGLVHQLGTRLYKAGPGLVERGPLEEGLFECQDDWSSVAYFYLNSPENNLPPLPPAAERLRGLE